MAVLKNFTANLDWQWGKKAKANLVEPIFGGLVVAIEDGHWHRHHWILRQDQVT